MGYNWSIKRIARVAVVVLAISSCSSATTSSHSTSPVDASTSLEGSVMAYADALLHGSPADYNALQSTHCEIPTGPQTDGSFAVLRANIARGTGVDLSQISVTGAVLRKVTSTTGEAEPTYNLLPDKVGNYNWIAFVNEGGHWLVTDCTKLPIGGEGGESSSSVGSPVPN